MSEETLEEGTFKVKLKKPKQLSKKDETIKIDFSNPIDVIVDIIENREKDFSNEINRLWQIEKIY